MNTRLRHYVERLCERMCVLAVRTLPLAVLAAMAGLVAVVLYLASGAL